MKAPIVGAEAQTAENSATPNLGLRECTRRRGYQDRCSVSALLMTFYTA